MKTFAGVHSEIAAFGAWGKRVSWTGSYAKERFNSLDSFIFVNDSRVEHAARWSLLQAPLGKVRRTFFALPFL